MRPLSRDSAEGIDPRLPTAPGRATAAGDDGRLLLPGGVEVRVQVPGTETGGTFVLLTDVAPPGWSLPTHRHTRESETIHITAGRHWLEVDGRRREMGPGDTAFVARGTPHSGGTLGEEPVRRVIVFSPAGMEDCFAELHAVTDPATALQIAQRYGWAFA